MTIRNNSGDDAKTRGRMSGFDALPKALRVALANADHNWSGDQLNAHRRKHGAKAWPIARCVAFITANDKSKHDHDAARGLVMGGQR